MTDEDWGPCPQQISARRRRVAIFMDKGMGRQAIAKEVGASETTVRLDIKIIAARRSRPRNVGKIRKTPEIEAAVRALHNVGKLPEPISRTLRVPMEMVYDILGEKREGERRSDMMQDVVRYAGGGRTTVSHGISPESARRMALAMARGREVVSHTVESVEAS
jgi:hypothetical protein